MRHVVRLGWLTGMVFVVVTVATAVALAGAILNQTTPVSAPVLNDCTGETVLLEGNLHTVVHLGDSGSRLHLGEDVRLTGMKGSALPSGARYVEMDVQNTQANITPLGQQEFTAVRTMNLTRLGEEQSFGDGDDLRVHVTAHMTIHANGVVTADKTDARTECR